jgi:HSP20 family molecular chaperone IbpA
MLRTFWFDTVDPFRELTSLQQWMDQTLQQTLNSFAQTSQVVSNTAFVPKAEVFEMDEQVALKIEVPGLSEKDFEITLKPGLSAPMVPSCARSICRKRWM